MTSKRRITAALVALLLISCSDTDQFAPTQAGLLTNEPTFLRFSNDAHQAAEKSGSFWAVRGQARTLVLRYSDSGSEFMRFDVGANSLLDGDSVLISVQVDPNRELVFHFSPSGLRFNDAAPAVLTIDYSRANLDLLDRLLSLQAGIWKRELPVLPWLRVPSLRLLGTVEQAKVYDFTSFGMAVD